MNKKNLCLTVCLILTIAMMCVGCNKTNNVRKIINKVYAEDTNYNYLEKEDRIYVIGNTNEEIIEKIKDEFEKNNIETLEKQLVFVEEEKEIDLQKFYDGEDAVIKLENNKLKYEIYSQRIEIDGNAITNDFEVSNIEEKNDKIYVYITLTGDNIENLIIEAAAVTKSIIEINEIDKEVITEINTIANIYEISSSYPSVLKKIQ